MSGDDRPELRAVSDEETSPIESEDLLAEIVAEEAPELRGDSAQPQKEERRQKRGRRGWPTVLLILALVAACLGYLYEEQRAREFETRLTALQTELQEARQALRAHEERMQVVRGQVDDLAGRIGLLQQAVAIDAE